jgi:hypothetical protein
MFLLILFPILTPILGYYVALISSFSIGISTMFLIFSLFFPLILFSAFPIANKYNSTVRYSVIVGILCFLAGFVILLPISVSGGILSGICLSLMAPSFYFWRQYKVQGNKNSPN